VLRVHEELERVATNATTMAVEDIRAVDTVKDGVFSS
jgi:hypothetical protein